MLGSHLLYLAAIVPETVFEISCAGVIHAAVAILLSIEPRTRVGSIIWVHVDSVAVSFVQLVEAFIAAPIRVVLHAETIDLLILPFACELPAISPLVRAEARHYAYDVVSGVGLSIRPLLDAVSVALADYVVTYEG